MAAILSRGDLLTDADMPADPHTASQSGNTMRDRMWVMWWVVVSNVSVWEKSGCTIYTIDAHCCDVIMGVVASQTTSLTIVYSTVYSHADQRKHQSSASLAFVRGIHRGQVNSPHKCPVARKMFPFDDVIMHISHHGRVCFFGSHSG